MNAQSKPPGKPPGRPKYEPGEGYYSISDAASLLGRSDAAIRQRIERGTLPSEQDVLPNGERRRVIPKEAIDKLLPARKQDTDEVALKVEKVDANTRLLFNGLSALARVLDETNQSDAERHEELKANQEEIRRYVKDAVSSIEADRAERREFRNEVLRIMERQHRPWWKRLLGI